jgi:cell division inhibitor SepF
MPNAFRKISTFLGLTESDGYYEEDDIIEEAPAYTPRHESTRTETPRYEPRVTPAADTRRNDNIRDLPVRAPQVAPAVEKPISSVVTVQPRSFNDARNIGEEFRSGNPVIINLQEIDQSAHQRLIDYASGLVHGLEGKMERVTPTVFMIIPRGIETRDIARNNLMNDGFFNQS